MSETIRNAASAALQKANEGYWFKRQEKQLRAAEEGLGQVDSLVRGASDPGEAGACRLARAASQAVSQPAVKLAVLRRGLESLAAGAADGAGAQAGLAVRLLAAATEAPEASYQDRSAVAGALLDEVAALAPGASRFVGWARTPDQDPGRAAVLLQDLADGPPASAAEEAKLLVDLGEDRGLKDLLSHWNLAEVAALQAAAEKDGFAAVVARPLLEALAEGSTLAPDERVAVLARAAAHAEPAGAAEWLAREAVRVAAMGHAGSWQGVLKEALKADPSLREDLCRAVLERVDLQVQGDGEALIEAARDLGCREASPALAALALEAADRTRGAAAKPWHAALRAALQASPDTAGAVLADLEQQAPGTGQQAARAAAAVVAACEYAEDGLEVARRMAGEVARLAGQGADATEREAALLAADLARASWTDGPGGLAAARRALEGVPEPSDPPASAPDPLVLASLAREALEQAACDRDRETCARAALASLARAAGQAGAVDMQLACAHLDAALASVPEDHRQRAEAAALACDMVTRLDTAADFRLTDLVRSLVESEGLDESVQVQLVRRLAPPFVDQLRRSGQSEEADRLELLGRLVDLDLDSHAVRLRILSRGLEGDLPEEVPPGLPRRAALARLCAGAVNAGRDIHESDGAAVFAEALKAVGEGAPAEQAGLLEVLDRALLEGSSPDSPGSAVRDGLLRLVSETPDGPALGWACTVARQALEETVPEDRAAAFWTTLCAGLRESLPEGKAGQLMEALLKRGDQALARAEDDAARAEAVREALDRLRDEELIRMVGGARSQDPGSIEVEEGEVTIGDVKVPRRRSAR